MRQHWVRLSLPLIMVFLVHGSLMGLSVEQAGATEKLEGTSIVRRMCDYLESLPRFSFRAEILDDDSEGGERIQYAMDLEMYVQRPDKLRINAKGDRVDKEFFMDGTVVTLYDRSRKIFGSINVPPAIEEALSLADGKFGLRVALADLASPRLWDHITKGGPQIRYVGLHAVRRIPCHHLVIDNRNLHLQVWIDGSDKPLLRKIIFSPRTDDGSPQWTAYLNDWNTTSLPRDNGLFRFEPPADAVKAIFVPVSLPDATGKKGGKN